MEELNNLTNNLSYAISFHQDKIIHIISWYENLFISIISVLFYYWLCCILKRDYKEWKNGKKRI